MNPTPQFCDRVALYHTGKTLSIVVREDGLQQLIQPGVRYYILDFRGEHDYPDLVRSARYQGLCIPTPMASRNRYTSVRILWDGSSSPETVTAADAALFPSERNLRFAVQSLSGIPYQDLRPLAQRKHHPLP